MKLIVNTNRIIAALIRDSTSRKILLSDKIEFATVNFSKVEMERYKKEIFEKAGINEKQFERVASILFRKIEIIGDENIKNKMKTAKEVMDKIHPADTPFIAAALSIENNGIWTDDKHFEKQGRIKIWKTKDLLGFI